MEQPESGGIRALHRNECFPCRLLRVPRSSPVPDAPSQYEVQFSSEVQVQLGWDSDVSLAVPVVARLTLLPVLKPFEIIESAEDFRYRQHA